MKKYDTPEIEITKFKAEEILVASGPLSDTNGGVVDGNEEDWE